MSDDGISSERESTTSERAQEWVDNNVGLNDDMETSHCVSSNVESMPSKHFQKREDKVDESSGPMWIDVGPIKANSKERVCESDHDSSCGSTCVVSSLEHACSIGSDVARALRIQKYICASEGACLDELLKKHTSNTGSRSYKIATEIQRIKHAAVQMFNATSDFQVPVPVPVPSSKGKKGGKGGKGKMKSVPQPEPEPEPASVVPAPSAAPSAAPSIMPSSFPSVFPSVFPSGLPSISSEPTI